MYHYDHILAVVPWALDSGFILIVWAVHRLQEVRLEMPIYEYRCPKCGVFEVTQRITEKPLQTCPKCGEPVKKLISQNIGIIFKGPGFYVTDNRNGGSASKDKSADS
jgi:putative FmdB family regulatory protein